jgi:hypothetical protein
MEEHSITENLEMKQTSLQRLFFKETANGLIYPFWGMRLVLLVLSVYLQVHYSLGKNESCHVGFLGETLWLL